MFQSEFQGLSKMKLSIRTFCLLCLISSGSTKLPPTQWSDERQLSSFATQPQLYFSHVIPTNETHENEDEDDDDEENHNLKRDIPYGPEPWRDQNSDFKRNTGNDRTRTRENYNEPKPRMFKTYGRGKAQLIKHGQVVNIPNEVRQNLQAYKDTAPVRAMDRNENEVKTMRHRGGCRECPTDQSVVATKGNPFAILPEPCPSNPRMWNHHSGPRPGSQIREGVHSVRGYIGPKKKFCQYHYQVIVRRCEPLQTKEEATVECSAENSWGSICNISCGSEKEPIGPTDLECKEDLTWSNPIPECKGKNDCSTPKVKADSKISCQTANMTQITGSLMPNGSTCKFQQNGKEMGLICKDGRWKVSRKAKNSMPKKNKPKNDVCNPNPCQNDGMCYKSESNSAPICKCKPQIQGPLCELRECYYNICENNGLCFIQNQERICYCPPGYSGDTCQY